MSKLEIIGVAPSTYTRAILMACEEKGVAYSLTVAPPNSPAATAIHPFGKIPSMRHDDIELCESKAIATYIDRAFDGPRLFSDDPKQAAAVEQWISIVNTMMDKPMVRDYVIQYAFPKDGKPDRVKIDAAVEMMKQQIPLLEKAVAKSGHLGGDSFSFADINLMVILAYLQNFPESQSLLKDAPNLTAYFAKHSQRPSFKNTVPRAPQA